MDFKKKLKTRLYISVGYILVGIILTVAVNVLQPENPFLSTYGIALIVCGIVRIRNYFMITKDDETIRKQRIAETDERNILIASKAKNASFGIYILLASAAVIVLESLNKPEPAKMLAYTVCALVFTYWISYWIIRKKS